MALAKVPFPPEECPSIAITNSVVFFIPVTE
jgi:hypothetical protein